MYAQVDKSKENKSRAVANSVAQKKSNRKQGFGFVDNRPEVINQTGHNNDSIQRKMFIAGVEQVKTDDTYLTLNEVATRFMSLNLKSLWNSANNKRETIDRMISTPGTKTKLSFLNEMISVLNKPRSLTFTYSDNENAVRGVVGETKRPEGEKKEADLAKQVLSDKTIQEKMASASKKIMHALEEWEKGTLSKPSSVTGTASASRRFADERHKYKDYYSPGVGAISGRLGGHIKPLTPRDILSKPSEYGAHKQVAAIHDITDAMYADTQWQGAVNLPPGKQIAHYKKSDGTTGTERINHVRPHGQPINEDSEVMKQTREKGMSVDVGPSYTTARMMMLTESVNDSYDKTGKMDDWSLKITDSEKTAIALTLFAFWNREYWEAASGIHKYKFVIDMLSNFVLGADSTAYPTSIQQFMNDTKIKTEQLGRKWE